MLFYLCPFCSPRLIQNSFTGLELLSSQTPYQALKTNPTKPHKENWMVATKTLSFSLSASLFHSAVNQQCMISITAVWSNCQVRLTKNSNEKRFDSKWIVASLLQKECSRFRKPRWTCQIPHPTCGDPVYSTQKQICRLETDQDFCSATSISDGAFLP